MHPLDEVDFVYDVPGTKCIRCFGIDRHSCRRLAEPACRAASHTHSPSDNRPPDLSLPEWLTGSPQRPVGFVRLREPFSDIRRVGMDGQ